MNSQAYLPTQIRTLRIFLYSILIFSALACTTSLPETEENAEKYYTDTSFVQETHSPYLIDSTQPEANQVRDIHISDDGTVWVATAAGVFARNQPNDPWQPVISGSNQGPAYDIRQDAEGNVWIAQWDGVYKISDGQPVRLDGPQAPIARILPANDRVYAFGPYGIWEFYQQKWQKMSWKTGTSFREVQSADDGSLWIATDVGLYHRENDQIKLYQDTSELISCYTRGFDYSPAGNLWVGGLGGVTIRQGAQKIDEIKPRDGLPHAWVNTIKQAPDGTMWVGTENGISRFREGSQQYSVRHSRRWLINNHVNDIEFDADGNTWIATNGGVSVIKRQKMSLAAKAEYFYDRLIKRHVREPWIVARFRLETPGDTTTITPDDDDNDGEYTAMYLVMESFRYAVTGDTLARNRATKAFNFLHLLREVTGMDGFFARTVIPADWTRMHDPNRTYSDKERAEMLVNDPRRKFVEDRWRLSEDGNWRWKGDTSSDELCGHMFGYLFYYLLVADQAEKERIAAHVSKIMDHLIRNDYNLTDLDGTHSRWGVWSPERLNDDPNWGPESALNSLEILSFLKFSFHITQNNKYQDAYRYLIDEHQYLDNVRRMHNTNPAWFTYFDIYLAAYVYPSLLLFEEDPDLKAFYESEFETWFQQSRYTGSPFVNFLYNYFSGGAEELESSILFLQDAPLDLVDWQINNGQREDLQVVRNPVMEILQIDQHRPPSEYRTIRWDKNPWMVSAGNPAQERDPVYWLLPYWMGRYLELIREPQPNSIE